METETVRKIPEGWHQIHAQHPGHKDSKAEVIAAFEADDGLDKDLKTFLLAKIRFMDCRALEVHANLQIENGNIVGSFHLKPLF